jgi:hypothetical protein
VRRFNVGQADGDTATTIWMMMHRQQWIKQIPVDSSLDDHLNDDTLPASKDKETSFTCSSVSPMKKSDPNYTLVTRLLIHTAFDMDPTVSLRISFLPKQIMSALRTELQIHPNRN